MQIKNNIFSFVPQWLALCVLVLLVLVAFNWMVGPFSATWRYKTIVAVETPEGIKTGSAVREVTVKRALVEIMGLSDTRAFVKGEAVAVDLGKGRVLFALLKGFKNGNDHGYEVVFHAFPGPGGFTPEGLRYYRSLKNEITELKFEDYPLLVTFKNLQDPKTIKSVYRVISDNKYPARYTVESDQIAETFGQGVRLKSIKIQMTDEPVTWGIEKIIPWLPARKHVKGSLRWFP